MTNPRPEAYDATTPDPDAVMHAWRRLRFALGAAGIGTWHLDLRSNVATFDEGLNAIFGLEPRETQMALDQRFERIHPDDRDRVRRDIDRAIAERARSPNGASSVTSSASSGATAKSDGCATAAGSPLTSRVWQSSPLAR
jgi:PAS domain-containing protein